MPDDSRITELMTRLREELKAMRGRGPFPLHPNIGNALDIIAEILTDLELPELELGEVKAAVAKLQQDLKANFDADAEGLEKLEALAGEVEKLAERLDGKADKSELAEKAGRAEIPGIVDEALTPIREAIEDLKKREDPRVQQLIGRVDELETRLRALEDQPPGEGVSEATVRRIVEEEALKLKAEIDNLKNEYDQKLDGKADKEGLEENILSIVGKELEPVWAAITALENRDDPRIIALIARVEALEKQPPGGGVSIEEVRRLIKAEVDDINSRIETLQTEFNGKLDAKADKSDLDAKADKSDLDGKADKSALDAKADKSDLDAKADKSDLDAKADKSDLDAKADKSDLDAKADKSDLDAKADKSDLDAKADKSDLDAKADKSDLDAKADKSDLDAKADKSDLDAKADKSDLDAKADKSDLDAKADKSDLDAKADKSDLDAKADKSDLDAKADKSDLDAKADKSDLDAKADKSELTAKADKSDLDTKADKSDLDTKADKSDLAGKADKSDLDTKADKSDLAVKADKSDLDTKADKSDLAVKADKSDLDTKADKSDLAVKADKSDLDTKADKSDLAAKADKSDLDTKADKSELDAKADKSELAAKADKSDLDAKADKSELDAKADKSELDAKADKSDLDTKADKSELDAKADKSELAAKADKSELDAKADKSDLAAKADNKEINRIDEDIEKLRNAWIKDSRNHPGLRLARLVHHGWGIAGGLDIHSDDKDYITITPGIGITPAGELVVEPGLEPGGSARLADDKSAKATKKGKKAKGKSPCEQPAPGNLVFSHYQVYPKTAGYEFFKKPDSEAYYEVWELLSPADNLPADTPALTPQDDAEYELPFISDKIVLLLPDGDKIAYLLMRREDVLEKLCCLPSQCDPDDRQNADFIHEEDYSPEDDYISDDDVWACLHPAVRLPEIPLFRFGYFTEEECAPDELDVTEFPDLKTLDDFYTTWKPIISDAIGRLEKAVRMLIRRYHPTLFPLLDEKIFTDKLEDLSEKWTRFTTSNDPPKTLPTESGTKYYAQYFYDWLRDLIAGYHELRWALTELMNDLRPYTLETLARQHRHLLLGPAQQPDPSGLDAPLRDAFHQPPIYNDNAARLESSRLYYRRLFQMIEGFFLENYAPKSKAPGWCYQEEEEVILPNFERLRITPGKSYIYPLSEQSIPFYYPLINHPQSLQHCWNYRRAKTRSVDRLLSYHATDTPPTFPSYSRRREVVRPLFYSLDPHDFYRIEGHIGKSKVRLYPKAGDADIQEFDVYEALQFLVRKYNLDFKVMAVRISDLQRPIGGMPPYLIGGGTDLRHKAQSFALDLLSAEHLAGVPKGGTFILVLEDVAPTADVSKAGRRRQAAVPPDSVTLPVDVTPIDLPSPRVIADFSLPYRLDWELEQMVLSSMP